MLDIIRKRRPAAAAAATAALSVISPAVAPATPLPAGTVVTPRAHGCSDEFKHLDAYASAFAVARPGAGCTHETTLQALAVERPGPVCRWLAFNPSPDCIDVGDGWTASRVPWATLKGSRLELCGVKPCSIRGDQQQQPAEPPRAGEGHGHTGRPAVPLA